MKKLISLFLCIMLMILFALPALAARENIEYLDDGSYLLVSDSAPVEDEAQASGFATFFQKIISLFQKILAFFKGQKIASKTKYLQYYDSNGVLLWYVSLYGEFAYSDTSAIRTEASLDYEIYDNDWSLQASACSYASNTAEADFTMQQHKLGVPLKTISKHMTLTCDTSGNIN